MPIDFHSLPDIEDVTKAVDSNVSTVVAPYDVNEIAQKFTDMLSDADKIQFCDNFWRQAATCALDTQQFGPKKQIIKWLDQCRWLVYSAHNEFKGGWCEPYASCSYKIEIRNHWECL